MRFSACLLRSKKDHLPVHPMTVKALGQGGKGSVVRPADPRTLLAWGQLRILAVLGLLVASQSPAGRASASDVMTRCRDCPVVTSELSRMARWLRANDVVFEGTCVGADTVRTGYERGRPLLRFRLHRLLRGIAPTGQLEMMMSSWRDVPERGTLVLGWILRGCTIDRHPCGSFVTLTAARTMLRNAVDSDWRREATLLSCDSLETAVVQMPDSTGLEAFDQVDAVALAQLEIRDPVNPARPGRIPTGFPDNGGTWQLEGFRWLVGRSSHVPHFVRFPQVRCALSVTEVHSDDRFLLPIIAGADDDTFIVKTVWRPMLVRNGEAVGFGVSADSLESLYAREKSGYHLTVHRGP